MNTIYEINTRPEFRHPAYVAPQRRVASSAPRASLVRYSNERCRAHVNEALYLSLFVVTMFATCVALVVQA